MPKIPYYGFNYPYYNNYMYHQKKSNNFYNNYSKSDHQNNKSSYNSEESFSEEKTEKSKKTNKSNNNFFSFDKDDYIFDLFGLKLYFDDILILSILFFLYKEEVKDYSLFISLLLLLLS